MDRKKVKNYGFVAVFCKLAHPVAGVLFYAAAFFIVLCFILSIILFFVNVDVDKALLPPFISKIANEAGKATKYEISFGNGIKVVTDAANVTLDDIKAALYAEIFVIACTLLTLAPIFKFLSALMKNIGSGEFEKIIDEKNPRYVMFIGLCVFFGAVLIRFMTRFYNYYLAARFIKGAPQQIKLSLGIDILDGMTGLAILFIGAFLAYAFQHMRERQEPS